MLKFSYHNSKMNKLADFLGLSHKEVVSFDLPAGYTCPCADMCLSRAHRITGKITDGHNMKFRCYAASSESAFTAVRKLRWHNFIELKKTNEIWEMECLIAESLPKNVKVVRVHSSGDFYSYEYFDAWRRVAYFHPNITFFGYTKVLDYVKKYKTDNFHLVYSYGGKMDSLRVDEPTAYVVNTVEDGLSRGLPVACVNHPADDYLFVTKQVSFALPIHGTQPKRLKLAIA